MSDLEMLSKIIQEIIH